MGVQPCLHSSLVVQLNYLSTVITDLNIRTNPMTYLSSITDTIAHFLETMKKIGTLRNSRRLDFPQTRCTLTSSGLWNPRDTHKIKSLRDKLTVLGS